MKLITFGMIIGIFIHLNLFAATVKKSVELWPNGGNVHVYFLNGTLKERQVTKKYANYWTKYANVDFVFHFDGDFKDVRDKSKADITVEFNLNNYALKDFSSTGGGHSALALDAKYFTSRGQASMEIRTLSPSVIIHEFGHALGLAHEHQRPTRPPLRPIPPEKNNGFFDIEKKLIPASELYSDYDINSVMHYEDAFDLFQNPNLKPTPNRPFLSLLDRIGVAELYPGRVSVSKIIKDFSPFSKQYERQHFDYSAFLYYESSETISLPLCQEFRAKIDTPNEFDFFMNKCRTGDFVMGRKSSSSDNSWKPYTWSCYRDRENMIRAHMDFFERDCFQK